MKKKYMKHIDVKGKVVFCRNDFNVPLNENREIVDDTRLEASLSTLKYLIDKGAKIVCASHMGRPEGKKKPELSLKPVADKLSEMLKTNIIFNGEVTGKKIDKIKSKLEEGEILLLENLRFNSGETKNDKKFAKELAKGIDVYINNAFGVSHRKHASVVKITEFVPISVEGFLLKREVDYLSLAIEEPPENFCMILGGAKVSDKIPIILNLMDKVKTILIGGAMSYTFMKAKGISVGGSKVDNDFIEMCSDILIKAEENNVKILLPVDHIASIAMEPNVTIKMVAAGEEIPENMKGFDIGIDTTQLYTKEIKEADLIVWNGPMGVFEIDLFSGGTTEIAKAVAESKALSIVGGGDTVSAIHKAGVSDKISHISTGGGASLEFLSGKKLPGIEALTEV